MTPTAALRDAAALLRELAATMITEADELYPEHRRIEYPGLYGRRHETMIEPAKRGIALADQLDTITG